MSDVMIEAKGLGKSYGDFVALQNTSFELHRGEILGLLGPNGAGKSTTMRILTCFIAPTHGTAKVAGCDIWDDPLGVRQAIGYLPESTPLYGDMLVLEYLEWAASMRGLRGDAARRRTLAVVEEVGLEEVVAKSIRELSKGYKQRVGLAQALIHEPPILILDEPLSGLDPNQASEIRALIKSIGKERTIILSTHNLAEVQVTCQRVLIIDKGRIVADDTPDALARGVDGPRYHVSVLAGQRLSEGALRESANGPNPRDVFGKIRGIESVRELPSKDSSTRGGPRDAGELRLELLATTDDDLRAEIFRAAVEAGLVLIGLSAKAQNLEQVFRDLTSGAVAASSEDEQDDEEEDDEEETSDDEGEDSGSDDDSDDSDDEKKEA